MLGHSSAKRFFWLPALLFGMFLVASCDNDLNKIKAISAKRSTNPVDSTTGVDVIYSDSAKVKVHLLAPLMLQHEGDKDVTRDYEEMPRGIKVIFYDSTRKESGTITADSAIQHEAAKIIEFHKNVVATNAAGETFKSDELIWDQLKKIMYSNKPVTVTLSGGSVVRGDTFKSDDQLTHQTFGHANGVFPVNDDPTNPQP